MTQTLNPKPQILNPKPQAPNPKPYTQTTPNPKSGTLPLAPRPDYPCEAIGCPQLPELAALFRWHRHLLMALQSMGIGLGFVRDLGPFRVV